METQNQGMPIAFIKYGGEMIKLKETNSVILVFQQLESICWSRNGEEFMSAHADGSYIVWSSSDSTEPKEPALTPYGLYLILFLLLQK